MLPSSLCNCTWPVNLNNTQGHAQLLKLLRTHPTAQVICEATGGYEQPPVRALQAATIPVSIIEAGRVRRFAKAKGHPGSDPHRFQLGFPPRLVLSRAR